MTCSPASNARTITAHSFNAGAPRGSAGRWEAAIGARLLPHPGPQIRSRTPRWRDDDTHRSSHARVSGARVHGGRPPSGTARPRARRRLSSRAPAARSPSSCSTMSTTRSTPTASRSTSSGRPSSASGATGSRSWRSPATRPRWRHASPRSWSGTCSTRHQPRASCTSHRTSTCSPRSTTWDAGRTSTASSSSPVPSTSRPTTA